MRAPITVGGVPRALLDDPVVRDAVAQATAERMAGINAAEAARQRQEKARQAEHESAIRCLRRRVVARRTRVDIKLAARQAPPLSSDYAIIVVGTECLRPLVYGLVDPTEPNRVRYVGQTTCGAVSRFEAHVSEARLAAVPSKRMAWILALLAEGRAPNMVHLETVPLSADLDARERWWITAMRERGEADLNGIVPRAGRIG